MPFMPAWALAPMVLIIKNLVITVTVSVFAPVRIVAMKIHPVMGVFLVPHIPPGRIPLIRSDDIGGSISVIGGPAILRAKKVMQNSI